MALIRFNGRVKSKRFDQYGNCYVCIDIDDCYKISHINNDDNIGSHTPRCNEFKITNERPYSCVNSIDVARYCEVGDLVTIKAYELYDNRGIKIDRYQTANFYNNALCEEYRR